MNIDFGLLQLAIFGFFTGLGTTFGTEVAKYLMNGLKERKRKALEKITVLSRNQ